jgi:chloride channel protein, CIC family
VLKNVLDFRGLQGLFTSINPRTIYMYSIVIGLLSGLGAIVFNEVLHVVSEVTMQSWAHLPGPLTPEAALGPGDVSDILPPRRWLWVLLPVVGGLISGLLVKTFAPEAEGTGTDGYIDAFHNHGGSIRRRVPLVKSLATLATLSSGGSAGKEGPIAQIGAGIGSSLGRFLKMGARARRTLMVAGAAGGLGAIFRAPLGGALTAVEVLYKEDIETDALTPAIISSVSAYTLFSAVNGFDHVFAYNAEAFHEPAQLIFYAALGLLCSAAGYLYVRFLRGSKRVFFDRLPINKYLIPPIGGLLVGLVGLAYPQAMGQGFGYVQQLMLDQPIGGIETGVRVLATLALLKIVTTSFTISSGGSGGVFAPSLFIGAMLGGCIGTLSHQFFPDLVPDVTPFVVVGMGAFFAGVANAPIASLVMVAELTGAYELLPPLMVVAVLALITSRRWSVYATQVPNKFSTRAHLWEMNPNVLKRVTIGEAMRGRYSRSAIIPHDLSLTGVESFASESGERDLLLMDGIGGLSGLLSLNDVEDREELEDASALLLADDLVNRRIIFLRPQDNLISALEFFGESEFDKLPIVESAEGHDRLLGHIRYRDIIAFYQREHDAPLAQSEPGAV